MLRSTPSRLGWSGRAPPTDMARPKIIDTRKLGAVSQMLDGFVHVLPGKPKDVHLLTMNCWCDPKMTWPKDGDTCVVKHPNKERECEEWIIYGV